VRLSSLELAAGTWTLQVSGDGDPDSTYEVRVVAGAPATPDGETEPNDNDGSADTWDTADVMHGTSRYGDVDEYRVHIPEGQPMIWRLDIAGGHLSAPEWRQPDGTHVGSVHVSDDATSVTIDDLYLVSGDHLLTVRGGDDYTLTLTLIGPPDLTAEREPNDDADHARLLPMAAERTGRLPVGGDVDVFRFSLSAPEHVVISADPSASGGDGIQLADATLELEITSATTSLVKVPAPAAGGPTVFDGLLPQADYEVWVRPAPSESGLPPTGDIVYSIDLERADPFVDPAASPSAPLPAELTLTTTTPEVAAYWRDGQRVEATLHIAPGAGDGLDLDLEATTSHHAWRVEIPAHVTVPSDGLDVPLTIHVPSDAWRDIPVRITVRATDAGGAQASAWTEIVPRQDPAPVSEEAYWPIPDALLGGLDAASLAVGGRSPTGNYREDQAHDDLVIAGTGYSQYFPNGPVTTTVDLAGDDPVPVAGTIIDPLGGAGTFGGRPRAFQLLLSLDGETYTSVLSGELGPQALEQAFVLPEPVDARFARLEVDTSWGGTSGPVDIGEWKVVAPPGWAPSPDGFDLADPVRGGHISASEPEYRTANDMLSATDTNVRTVLINAGASQRIAIGFADDRAAQITGLRWQDPPGSDPAVRIPSVGVEVTEDSPLGPWRDVGTWQLVRAADGSVAPFDLPEPTWARFVRLTLPGATDADKYWDLPSKLSILERPTDDVYRSILGQWGQSSPRGIHEVLVPPPVDTSAEDVDVPDTADAAAPLAAGDVANGRVARSVDTDWYQLTVPADQNTLTIRLDTERAGDVVPRLIDASGADVPLTTSGTAGGVTATTIVEPGASYRLELVQPILSVVFTFDTSSSIKPWYPLVRAAIGTFATGVRPGLEAVQVFPFEEHDLLQGFSDQAYLIQSAIDAWTTEGGSSFLQASIERAAATLLERDGARAVLAIGDAVGGGFQGGLPVGKIELSNPAIFPVHVGATDDPAVSTHIMQDLAVANGGYYQYATSLAEMERAFDRMATWMRRPAAYALSYQTSLVDYPPGSIGVAPAEGAQVRIGGVAVELVLDTSTSMNIRIGAQTRMAVAKKSLSSLVQTALPEGLPVALRIFKPGSNGKQSCDSTLAVPIGPLDRAAMLDRIKRLKIGKGTRTPLAATIEAVKDDIGNVKGPRIVVVVTDGNESCKGDPQAAVKALVEAGFDTTVNIVGLALEDERLKDKMASWAATGGGVFLDAQDQAGLSAAIAQTLRAPFRVIDDTGAVVGEGIVGDAAVSVPIGTYRVEVLSEPPVTFEDVQIGPNQAVIFTVGDE
jgi:Mg-chelatase subunit ChlD